VRNLHLAASAVLVLSSACVDLTRPLSVRDGGGDADADAMAGADRDAPADTVDGAIDGTPDADAGRDVIPDVPPDTGALAKDLVGYWRLDTNSGGVAPDSSGQGNNGAIDGLPGLITTVPSAIKFADPAAFSFSAMDDAVSVADRGALHPAALTVALWVRFSSSIGHHACGNVPAGLQYLFHRRTSRTSFNMEAVALMRTQDGRFAFVLGDDTGNNKTELDVLVSGGQTVATGIWYHVAGTYDGSSQVRVYVNGVVQASTSRTQPIQYGTRPLFLGRSGECMSTGSGDQDWDVELSGALDDVRVYDRALSSQEVMSLAGGSD
jgi:hypothetical protein